MIWIIVWSELLTNLTINNKISIILQNGLLSTAPFYLRISENNYFITEMKTLEMYLKRGSFQLFSKFDWFTDIF